MISSFLSGMWVRIAAFFSVAATAFLLLLRAKRRGRDAERYRQQAESYRAIDKYEQRKRDAMHDLNQAQAERRSDTKQKAAQGKRDHFEEGW